MSNYTFFRNEVLHFRQATGLPVGERAVNHALHLRLFSEEAFEFVLADTLRGQADALADMIVIACGYAVDAQAADESTMLDVEPMVAAIETKAWSLGINIIGAFKLVHASNMSKVCDKEDAAKTVTWFRDTHKLSTKVCEVSVIEGSMMYAVYSMENHKEYPAGKLLKPVSYFKPQWHEEDKWLNPAHRSAEHNATDDQLKTAVAGVQQELDNIDPEGKASRNWENDERTTFAASVALGGAAAEETKQAEEVKFHGYTDPETCARIAGKSTADVQEALKGKYDVPLNQKDPRSK